MATPQTTVTPTKPAADPVTPLPALPADLPTFAVADRMSQHGTIEDLSESEVSALLNPAYFTEPMTTTWINSEEPGRLHHVINTLGWRQVKTAWLKPGTMSGAWATTSEGYLTRGDKGGDLAVLMPTRFYTERMRKMAEARSAKARDVAGLRDKAAARAAAQGDHRGADAIGKARLHVTAFNETRGVIPDVSGDPTTAPFDED